MITGKMITSGKKSDAYYTVSNFNYPENHVWGVLPTAQKSGSRPSDTGAHSRQFVVVSGVEGSSANKGFFFFTIKEINSKNLGYFGYYTVILQRSFKCDLNFLP